MAGLVRRLAARAPLPLGDRERGEERIETRQRVRVDAVVDQNRPRACRHRDCNQSHRNHETILERVAVRCHACTPAHRADDSISHVARGGGAMAKRGLDAARESGARSGEMSPMAWWRGRRDAAYTRSRMHLRVSKSRV